MNRVLTQPMYIRGASNKTDSVEQWVIIDLPLLRNVGWQEVQGRNLAKKIGDNEVTSEKYEENRFF